MTMNPMMDASDVLFHAVDYLYEEYGELVSEAMEIGLTTKIDLYGPSMTEAMKLLLRLATEVN